MDLESLTGDSISTVSACLLTAIAFLGATILVRLENNLRPEVSWLIYSLLGPLEGWLVDALGLGNHCPTEL